MFVVAAYHLNDIAEEATEDHKALLSAPNAQSTLAGSTVGLKTILVPVLLVVNVGTSGPTEEKSILFPVAPFR